MQTKSVVSTVHLPALSSRSGRLFQEIESRESRHAPIHVARMRPGLCSSEESLLASLMAGTAATVLASTFSFAVPLSELGEPFASEYSNIQLDASVEARRDALTPEALREVLSVGAAVDAEPVEDGVIHPAERSLADVVARVGIGALLDGTPASRSAVTREAAIFRLLGRIDSLDPTSRRMVVRRGLASSDTAVRDATVQAIESWGDRSFVP